MRKRAHRNDIPSQMASREVNKAYLREEGKSAQNSHKYCHERDGS